MRLRQKRRRLFFYASGIGCLLLVILALLVAPPAVAEQQRVQLSGYVTREGSNTGLAGVAVYALSKSQGTQTAKNGFFSITVLAGDTVVFSALGYQKQVLVITAASKAPHYTINVRLRESPKTLPTVEVMPWATEQALKQAVLGVKLPEAPKVDTNIGSPSYNSILYGPQMDAKGNARYFQQQQTQQAQSRYLVPSVIRIL